jgi:preprotein translocase subunit SecF
MYERAVGAFARLPSWRRIVVVGLSTCVILWFVWAAILVLFAFALTLGIVVAVVASLFVLLRVRRLIASMNRYR